MTEPYTRKEINLVSKIIDDNQDVLLNIISQAGQTSDANTDALINYQATKILADIENSINTANKKINYDQG